MSLTRFYSRSYSIFNCYEVSQEPSQSGCIPHYCKESSDDCSTPKVAILLDIGLNSQKLARLQFMVLSPHLKYPLTPSPHLVVSIHLARSCLHDNPFEPDFFIFSVQQNMRVTTPLIDILALLLFLSLGVRSISLDILAG